MSVSVSSQKQTNKGMQKSTMLFCCLTTALLLALAFAVNLIGHTPWGLIGAAILVLALTAQQCLAQSKSNVKPKTTTLSHNQATRALKASRGVA